MKISSIKANFINANYRKNYTNKNINFNRKWQEHQSWGVRINSGENGETNAKIFTFPDAKYVQLQVNENTPEEKVFELQNMGDGVFEGIIPQGEIKEGDRYHFVIQKANNAIVKVKDPYSFYQPTLNGASSVYNHNRFNWTDDDWFKASNTQRISRKANSLNGLTPVEGAIIYEMNIATLTQGGDFKSAKQ
ncbi:MAG: hypothetical protein IJW73_05585 [Candidatus Gastranaerophilales bacterium]|nr:hypothetical protein [Candidatus Gastranaerophilales bacterium]